ncbi:MAG: FAD-dependent monooxygenase, partial [Flavobacterium sp.]
GRIFSHFIYENEKAVSAVFQNDEMEYGDLVIGADGSNSKVREQLFGKTDFTLIQIKEIVGISKTIMPFAENKTIFQKFQDHTKGLSFGCIPTYNDEMVWFMQYDVNLIKDVPTGETDLKLFCETLTAHFPAEVKQVLNGNDFNTSYVWNTRDFDLLPSFHKNNVCLLGDAAHLALPFTSAGTSNALLDAKTIVECLEDYSDFEKSFEEFYLKRKNILEKHISQGREIKQMFLQPTSYTERDFLLPLIKTSRLV